MDSFGRSALDDLWRSGGTAGVRRTFVTLAYQNTPTALSYINDDRLSFPVFFILLDEIIDNRIIHSLSPRNLAAFYVCTQKIKRIRTYTPEVQPDNETLYGTLRWILDTGIRWDGPSGAKDDYDAVIDYAAALVIAEFGDKTILPEVADLIFWRNRRGLYIHDLVWSFFQAVDHEALARVAEHLGSANQADRELAADLLALDLPNERARTTFQTEQQRCLDWLRDNRPYLFLTGEHLQMTSRPKHIDCDMEAKYLDKEISPHDRAVTSPLTKDEAECLQRYRETSKEEQGMLSEYSHKLRSKDKGQWQAWMRRQIAEQVMAAKTDIRDEAI